MLLCAAGAYGVVGSRRLRVPPTSGSTASSYTSEDAVTSALALQQGANLVRLRTDALVDGPPDDCRRSATRRSRSSCPTRSRVDIDEREPILIWAIGRPRASWSTRTGLLFAPAGDESAGAIADLPVIDDARVDRERAVGRLRPRPDRPRRRDPPRLASRRRTSAARPPPWTSTVDDTAGFVVSTGQDGWIATFGIYTPTLRPPSMVPGQVRLLRSILIEHGEANLARIDLAKTTAGTFELKNGK